MSTLDVVAEVLREVAPRALKARQIAELAIGRLPTASKTPETVISRDLAIDVRDHGAASRFLRVDRGAFVLKEALPTALYCDIDSYACAWTQALISAGEIAPGVVDERSIRDLKPADVACYRQFHAFNGISVWSRALRDAGWSDDLPIWSGSAPCQPWSSAGKRGGESDDRHLWPEWFRLIRACGPPIIVGEQVASKDGYRWLDGVADDFESIGYNFTATELSAASVGAPHRRQRIYFVAFLGGRASRIVSSATLGSVEATSSGTGLHALHARMEDEANAAGAGSDHDLIDVETTLGLREVMADSRERRCEIFGASWLHDRGQPGDDVARCGTLDGRAAIGLSDATGTRSRFAEDVRADRGDACEGAEAIEWRTSGSLEPERSGDADEAGTLSDAERVVWNEGWIRGSHGRPEVEPDRHGEAHGAIFGGAEGGNGCDCLGPVGVGDTSLARGGWDTGALPRAQEAGEGERIEAGDLIDQSVAPGTDDGAVCGGASGGALCGGASGGGVEHSAVWMVRGAAGVAGDDVGADFRPGDRIRLDGDPSWGSAVGGFWAEDVEWIYCRPEPGHQDGRWRPAKSGDEPLVAGSAPGVGRTRSKRLRCFGNSIVLPLATTFISAVIDTLSDASREITPQVAVASREITAPQVEDPSPVFQPTSTPEWTGPREGETAPSGMLYGRVPGDRWPYGPPSAHEAVCNLFPHRGSPGGLFCDCAASAADDVEYGVSSGQGTGVGA